MKHNTFEIQENVYLFLKNNGFSSSLLQEQERFFLKDNHIGLLIFLRSSSHIDQEMFDFFKPEFDKNFDLTVFGHPLYYYFIKDSQLKDFMVDYFIERTKQITKPELKKLYEKSFLTAFGMSNIKNLSEEKLYQIFCLTFEKSIDISSRNNIVFNYLFCYSNKQLPLYPKILDLIEKNYLLLHNLIHILKYLKILKFINKKNF